MFGGGSITLFHIRGIRIAVDWSWFLILFLVIFWMSNFYDDLLGPSASSTTPATSSGAGGRMKRTGRTPLGVRPVVSRHYHQRR